MWTNSDFTNLASYYCLCPPAAGAEAFLLAGMVTPGMEEVAAGRVRNDAWSFRE